MIVMLVAFICYLGLMVYVGLRNMKNTKSSSDFFLGGRKVGPWTAALSAEASDMSGWLLMGLPGLAYLGGIKEVFWTALGLTAGTYLNWLIVAKPLRKCTIAFGDSITLPEFFTNRFKDSKHLIATVSVVFILLFFTIYTASGFVACAKLFNSVFGIPYRTGLVIGLIVILTYTLLGGFMAVCTTDFIQGSLMFVALVVTMVVITVTLGGPASAFDAVTNFSQRAMSGEFGQVMQEKFTANQSYGVTAIISALAWGLGYFGMPHILVRFMGIRSGDEVAFSRRVATIWVVFAFIGAWVVGSFGTQFLASKGIILNPAAAETVFSVELQSIYPAFIAGLFLCGILAAAMSTADSQLLVASSAFSRDIFKAFIKPDASEKTVLNVSRITVLAISAIAFCLSLDPSSSIFDLVSYAWAGFGATFGPIILLALFWKGATRNGAFAGLICGGITVVVWNKLSGGLFDVYEILPGFIVTLAVAVAVSLCDKNKDAQMIQEFEAYKAMKD
ncbi:MAG: sodium/proline symporter PutP [Treponemataceae bacterium]|nr:sodium/proline symporter PutP [Treponemataceae bacterium]